jgi:beta-galactosidase/beta-glucuronidase
VDWLAKVWINGRPAGEHRGGYTSFSFEVTHLVNDGDNELVVYAFDDTRSGLQATGKQSHSLLSEGCCYTRTTGIWQTVWLEAVGNTYLRQFTITPDLDNGRIHFQGWVDGPCRDVKLRLRAYHGKDPVGEETIPAAWRNTLGMVSLSKVTAWEPGKPFLYDLQIDIIRSGSVLDTVRTYFGLRKLTIQGNRFLINNKPIFQRLILDQGFYPDGIYTARDEETLKQDIQLSMEAGFSGARLHQKVFEPRFLYWADRLGYLVWGEYPNWGINLREEEALTRMAEEWFEEVQRDRNHPSIIGWCPLNETGDDEGTSRAQRILSTTRKMDPTRPYLDTSGWVHFDPETDIYDAHDYDQNPVTFRERFTDFAETGKNPFNNNLNDPRSAYHGQPYFISEYGGIKLASAGSSGSGWGYGETDVEDFFERYKGLTDVLLDHPFMFAFCYTQLTDVEQEQNGIYTYERKARFDIKRLAAINRRIAEIERG